MRADKDLTILLTLKDRVPFTIRWMSYANKINFPFKILIADGGADETVAEILSDRASFPNVDYEYGRYPYDRTYTQYYAKVVDALLRIETPFVAMADNDDFYIVEGLRRSVDFLQRDPDYRTCRGQIGSFSIKPDPGATYGQGVVFGNLTFDDSIVHGTAAQRVRTHFTPYTITFYDVHRTEDLRINFRILRDLDLQNPFLVELLLSFLTIAAGKVKRESYLYLLRQIQPFDSHARRESRKRDHFDRMLSESWSAEFTGFVTAVAQIMAKEDGISIDDARDQVKQGYRIYIAPTIISCLSSRPRVVCMAQGLVRKLDYNSKTRQLLRKLYVGARGIIARIISSQARRRRVISVDRSSENYKDIRSICDFLTAQPPV